MKLLLSLYIILFCTVTVQGQDQVKRNLFFKLNKTELSYTKKVYNRTVTIKSKREYMGYMFSIKCTCLPEGLNFTGHNNPEVGESFAPISQISESAYRKLTFINLQDLLLLLKQYDINFNGTYNLYLVEPSDKSKKRYSIYHVKFMGGFVQNG